MSPTISSEPDRLTARFAAQRAAGRRALIPYITAGYPDKAATGDLLGAFERSGADVIELGVPFSDPVADGPTIQRSSQRALEAGVDLAWVLESVAAFRTSSDLPVVLFSYLNPILRMGVDRFIAESVSAGADGVLITDLPVGAHDALERTLEASDLALVRLVAPTTTAERAAAIARRAQGFLYYIARTGVTGATDRLRAALPHELSALRATTRVPIAVGFGISTPQQAAHVARSADGVVVGSALIDALDSGGEAAAASLLHAMREEIDRIV
ncbi:MAG: tryptophan synthase subunit alpha [Gemmatimonadetes bacterium]|nr:tryptophan synthase subunit alpha [Gemmatimonadota bacterium]